MKRAILVWICVVGLVVTGCSPVPDTADSFGSVGIMGNSWVEIWDWYDLDAIRDNLDGNYILMNDIDSTTDGYEELAGPDADEGKGWKPLGSEDYPFAGAFDGQGYEISALFIDRPDEGDAGLFGCAGSAAVIGDVGLVDVDVYSGDWHAGALVGQNHGTVGNSYSSGSVTGVRFVGALVGRNHGSGTVSGCHSSGNVAGVSEVGGVVGGSTGTVSNSHSSASTSGVRSVGGLVGWVGLGTVRDSYSTGSVTGDDGVGGLAGYMGGTVNNSHYNYDDALINGQSIITVGALFGEDFEQWLAQGKFLDVNDRLSQEDGYYLIYDVSDFRQLLAFGQDDTLKFRLNNDLDLGTEPNFYIPYLAGEFDGNGHTISNLNLSFGFLSYVGVFGLLASGSKVTQVRVENVDTIGNRAVGGLAGRNRGSVSHSHSTGSVTGVSIVGGLVGSNHYGTVSNSYSSGSLTGVSLVGGLVGYNWYSVVSDSHSTASVTGYHLVGGLAGSIWGGTLRNAYSSGSVSGTSGLGGLVGDYRLGTVTNSHYNYDEVTINGENLVTIGALYAEDFEEWLANDRFLDVDQRLSKEEDYYVINSVSDFKEVLVFGQDSSLGFRLKGDLDLATKPNFYIPYLAGEFHGNGHQISNLSFNYDFMSQVGLFGLLAPGGKVSEVGAENVNTTGDRLVGGLVGANYGTVTRSYSSGSVTGRSSVGGLVGENRDTVSNSYSVGSVTGTSDVGGLVGSSPRGTVSNSHSSASTSGASNVGGLVGYSFYATLENCYSRGSVSGFSGVGGLVGHDREGTVISNSFWDMETSGTEESDGGTGKTTAEMKNINTFLDAGWDIEFTLEADPTDGYPFLAWQLGGSPIWYIYGMPTVTTEAATDVTTDSAILNMSFTVGDYSPVEVRFSWREVGTDPWVETTWASKAADGTHAETLTGLDSDTTYEFKAQLRYNDTVIDGATLTFTMGDEIEEPAAECIATHTGTGTACFTPSHGTIEDFQALPVPADPPDGYTFPDGLFSFRITGLASGQTVTVTIELPSAVPAGTKWWKHHDGQWHDYNVPITISGNTITITLTDGGIGDIDGAADGIITDPGGPGNPVPPITVGWETYPINKLAVMAPWIVLLAVIVLGSGLLVLRRRSRVQEHPW